jgi:hypothetical protein
MPALRGGGGTAAEIGLEAVFGQFGVVLRFEARVFGCGFEGLADVLADAEAGFGIVRAVGAIIRPIIRARGDCLQPPSSPWPRWSESAADHRSRPTSGLPTIRESATLLYAAPPGTIY